jgi:hypothetical protein
MELEKSGLSSAVLRIVTSVALIVAAAAGITASINAAVIATAAAASLTALLRPSLVFFISPSEAGAADSGSAVQSIVLLMTGNFRPQHRSLYFPRCNNQIRQFPLLYTTVSGTNQLPAVMPSIIITPDMLLWEKFLSYLV